jgi:hypothetical protein
MGISLTPEDLYPPPVNLRLLLSVGEQQRIPYRVATDGCRSSSVAIGFEETHFELDGERSTDLGPGAFAKVVEWRLKAIAPGDNLSIDVVARADGNEQRATWPVVVRPAPWNEA